MTFCITLFFTLALTAPPGVKSKLPASLDLSRIRAVVVQHDGRWMPLDTAARDFVREITEEEYVEGCDPVLVLLAWTFDPQTWQGVGLIPIENAELREEIQLPRRQTVFSYAELIRHRRLHALVDELAMIEPGVKLNPLESKISSINKKLVVLQKIFFGRAVGFIPNPENALGPWRSVAWFMESGSEEIKPVQAAWLSLRAAFFADDAKTFSNASDQFVAALRKLPAAHLPSPGRIAAELRYNKLRPFRAAWILMGLGTLLAAAAALVRRRWFDGLALAAMMAGFGMLTYGLCLRWIIAGRLPATNMFESLLFLSWGMGAFAILASLFFRHRSVPLTASAMGALSLLLADTLPMDHFIRPIPPVLMDTIWMSIHVPIIMVSYSVLTLAVLIAHVQLIVTAAAPRRERMINAIDAMHCWYIRVGGLMLFVGIVTGSMWAASSWGRYWGWDPKEVWSLVAFLGYMSIIHVRASGDRVPRSFYAAGAAFGVALFILVLVKMNPSSVWMVLGLAAAGGSMVFFVAARGRFSTAVKSVLAFWMIIMTYVGVNYVLGIGLHSYGFGTGAIAGYVFMVGMTDLSLVALCSIVFLVRKGSPSSITG